MHSVFSFIRRNKVFTIVLAILFLTGAGLMINSRYECLYPRLVEEHIKQEGMESAKGLRVLHLTDIHNNMDALERAVEKAKNTDYDIVIFTGDLYSAMDRMRYSGDMIRLLSQLSSKAPAYACLGNHDTERLDNTLRILKQAGFQVLRNETTFVNIPRLNLNLKLVGLGDFREADFFPENCMLLKTDIKSDMPTIVLSHEPETAHLLNDYAWDFMFSGHTHGGQIIIPFMKPLMLGKDETMNKGYYALPNQRGVFLSPGLGYSNLPRFRSPGEINLITFE